MNGRKVAAGLVAGLTAAAATAVGVVAASPVSAASTTSSGDQFHLVGDFYDDGGGREEVVVYVRGIGPDALLSFYRTPTDDPGEDVTYDSYPLTVNGNYTPVAGDFDGDGWDEILWYAPGPALDYMWHFDGGTSAWSEPYSVTGTYKPFAGDFTGDGVDDIFWYGTGAAPDHVWEYNMGGSYTSMPFTAGGTYKPQVGSFGNNDTDDIFFYAPGSAPDYLWDFSANSFSYVSRSMNVSGTYNPFTLDIYDDGWRGGDIFWYAPGGAADSIWDFYLGNRVILPVSVVGSYLPAAGDLLGDDHSDILWSNAGGIALWDYYPDGGGGVDRYDYNFIGSFAAFSSSSAIVASGAPDSSPNTVGSIGGASLGRGPR